VVGGAVKDYNFSGISSLPVKCGKCIQLKGYWETVKTYLFYLNHSMAM